MKTAIFIVEPTSFRLKWSCDTIPNIGEKKGIKKTVKSDEIWFKVEQKYFFSDKKGNVNKIELYVFPIK